MWRKWPYNFSFSGSYSCCHSPEQVLSLLSSFTHFLLWHHAQNGCFLKHIGGLTTPHVIMNWHAKMTGLHHVVQKRNEKKMYVNRQMGGEWLLKGRQATANRILSSPKYSVPGTICSLYKAGLHSGRPPASSAGMNRTTSAPSNTGGGLGAIPAEQQCTPKTSPEPVNMSICNINILFINCISVWATQRSISLCLVSYAMANSPFQSFLWALQFWPCRRAWERPDGGNID